MFLGSSESPQRALQEYAEKHHCPPMEDKTKRGKVWPLYKQQPVKPPTPKTQQGFLTKSVFDKPWLVMKIKKSTKTQQGEKPNKNQEI